MTREALPGTYVPFAQSVSIWLGMHPRLANDTSRLLQLVEDVYSMLQPYGCESVYTTEPRIYAMTAAGRAALARAVAADRVRVMACGTSARGATGMGMITLSPHFATPRVGLTAHVMDRADPRLDATIRSGIGFIERWFPETDAAAGFISLANADSYGQTAHEAELREGALVTWQGVQRFLRGVFWGMALGPDLCDRLGGREAVMRTAPVPVVRSLGHGVWLQATPEPNSDPTLLRPLGAYLEPLLHWTRADTGAPPVPPAVNDQQRSSTPYGTRRSPRREARRITTHFMPGAAIDTGLNVYFTDTPTPAARTTAEEVVGRWYAHGVTGGFGGHGFHQLDGPTIDSNIMRWHIDFGSADARRAVKALANELANREDTSAVERIIVGVEQEPAAGSR